MLKKKLERVVYKVNHRVQIKIIQILFKREKYV